MNDPVELRCEENPARMFAKLLPGARVTENLFESSCRDCAKRFGVPRVLHRFDIAGKLVETVIVEEE